MAVGLVIYFSVRMHFFLGLFVFNQKVKDSRTSTEPQQRTLDVFFRACPNLAEDQGMLRRAWKVLIMSDLLHINSFASDLLRRSNCMLHANQCFN